MLTPPSVTEIRRPTTQEEDIQKDANAIRAVREQANMRTLTDFSVFFSVTDDVSCTHDGKRFGGFLPLPGR